MKKQSIDFDWLGDKHKKLEQIGSGARLVPGIPTLARLDGRAFHTVLRHSVKPFDDLVVMAMQKTAIELLKDFNADFAYVQSDEITLGWANLDVFDGRIQKIVSTTASKASLVFGSLYPNHNMATFDCRIWQVPDLQSAAENVRWREMDATKNSISIAASSIFSESELDGKSTKDRLAMLESKGFYWNELPHYLKRGTYYRKVERFIELTAEELSRIPEKFQPKGKVLRKVVEMQEYPKATSISNFEDVLFKGAIPDVQSSLTV